MNTPKTPKPPKRWSVFTFAEQYLTPRQIKRIPKLRPRLEDDRYLARIGEIATMMPMIENFMGSILTFLLGAPQAEIGHLVFRSIINQQTRLEVMRNLLQRSQLHSKTAPKIDELIEEFAAVNNLRNKYLHGLWCPIVPRVYLAEADGNPMSFMRARHVPLKELNETCARMKRLYDRLSETAQDLAEKRRTPKAPQPRVGP